MPNSLQRSAISSPASRRATNCSLSSITEHSFHGITPSQKTGGSVTHVSGTMCYLCLRPLKSLTSVRKGRVGRFGKTWVNLRAIFQAQKVSQLLAHPTLFLRHRVRVLHGRLDVRVTQALLPDDHRDVQRVHEACTCMTERVEPSVWDLQRFQQRVVVPANDVVRSQRRTLLTREDEGIG